MNPISSRIIDGPLVSIIAPVYKTAPYLQQCVDSILNQPYRNLELILVDDGSPDNSGEMCDLIASTDSRVKVIHKKNAGAGMARNAGLDVAKGEYIMFVDSDDWWNPGILESLVESVVKSDIDIVLFGFDKQQPNGSFSPGVCYNEEELLCSRAEIVALASSMVHKGSPVVPEGVSMSVWSAMFRRSLIQNIRFYSEREVASEDLLYKVEAILSSRKILILPLRVVNYRYTANSLSRTYFFEKFNRFKKLTYILKKIFSATERPSAGDMCMVYATSCALQGMYNCGCCVSDRKKWIRTLADDEIWDCLKLDYSKMNTKEKLIIRLVVKNNWRSVWLLSELFYSLKRLSPNRERISKADGDNS